MKCYLACFKIADLVFFIKRDRLFCIELSNISQSSFLAVKKAKAWGKNSGTRKNGDRPVP